MIEARRTERESRLAAANERLLVRLGFDLHDGPLQQVYVLAQDVRVLRDHVAVAARAASTGNRRSTRSPTSRRSSPSSTATSMTSRTHSSHAPAPAAAP